MVAPDSPVGPIDTVVDHQTCRFLPEVVIYQYVLILKEAADWVRVEI